MKWPALSIGGVGMMQWLALSRRSGVSGPAGVEQEFRVASGDPRSRGGQMQPRWRTGVAPEISPAQAPIASEKGNESHEV